MDINFKFKGKSYDDIFIEDIPENEQEERKGWIRTCDICGEETRSYNRNIILCKKHRLYCYCKNKECHKKIEIFNFKSANCSRKCNMKVLKQEGNCSICHKFNKSRDQNGRGKDCGCSKNWFQKHNSSEVMIEQAKTLGQSNIEFQNCIIHGMTKHFNGVCITCHNQSDRMREQAREQGLKAIKFEMCEKHGLTKHFHGHCITCHNQTDSMIQQAILLGQRKFVHKEKFIDYEKFNDERHQLKEKIKEHRKNQDSIYLERKFCHRCNEETDHYKNICSKEFPEFYLCKMFTVDGEVPFLDLECGHHSKLILNNHNYECWECYKNNYLFDKQSNYGGLMIPTFIDNERTVPGILFEQYLVENNITWFVYLKYHENGNVLVCGKTGSMLVNKSGSDLCFDKSILGGPARQLLIETDSDWNKTHIEIFNFDTELEALNFETSMQNKYNLLGS